MPCKHLLHYSHNTTHIWSVASCSAKNTPYVPSLNELERFCQSGRHIVCPAYLFSFETVGDGHGRPYVCRGQLIRGKQQKGAELIQAAEGDISCVGI